MLGIKLKKARKNKNMTLSELATATGISNGNLSNYELNKVSPSANAIISLCKVLDISADWLLLDKKHITYTNEDHTFFNKYNLLSERDKGKIDLYIDQIINNK